MQNGQAIVVVHGGAGTIETERLDDCVAGCLPRWYRRFGPWQENPAFNAGRGATLTRDGTVELDAAVMTGDQFFQGKNTDHMPWAAASHGDLVSSGY